MNGRPVAPARTAIALPSEPATLVAGGLLLWLEPPLAPRRLAAQGLALSGLAVAALYNIAGGVAWVASMTLLGYTVGQAIPNPDLVFPALIVGYRLSAVSARMTRSAMLEVLREDYIRTARAKGLTTRVVIMRHALRNGFIPVLTFLALQLSNLLGGSVIIESVFALPGVGTLTVNAIRTKDYTVIQGCVLFFGAIVVVMNLLVDVAYGFIDPRMRRR